MKIIRKQFIRKAAIGTAALGFAIVIGIMSANAQYSNMLRDIKGVTQEDRDLMKKTARFDMEGKEIGTILSWDNSDSGNRGQVKLIKVLEKGGYQCRKVMHNILLKTGKNIRLQFTLCNIEGEWKISE